MAFDIDANGILNVSAKDLGTNKEQKITITGSGGLKEEEIENMVSEAEANVEEDKERRKKVEAHNQLDQLVYGTEKIYEEHKESLSADDKGALESALESAKKALEGDDLDDLEQATQTLTLASHKVAEAMYKQSDAGGPNAADPTDSGGGDAPGSPPSDDEVVDAEYVDVEDAEDKDVEGQAG